ncbi:MAG: family 20 glycosylhydrolase [Rudaea sp.]
MQIRTFVYNFHRSKIILATLFALALSSCQRTVPTKNATHTPPSVIPLPVLTDVTPGKFILREGAAVNVRATNAEAIGIARNFSDLVARTRGIHLDVRPFGTNENRDAISFVIDPNLLIRGDTTDEGYELTVSSDRIVVAARTPHGLFNGGVTLWQLLTTADDTKLPASIPCVHIEDYPRFAWRGLMLDSSRHFQSPEFVKKFIDEMALHKLNVFHWHLTDDQGWRLEIKKYPKLTDVGAWRTPAHVVGSPQPYGGFYTQDQVRDIVRYAAERYVTIVPEIEMPGHAQAAIAAYPELGVTGKTPPVSPDWGVHTYLYNVDESTFAFLENILSEVMELFPGRYIHIGGDEAAKDQWQASPRVQQRMRELGFVNEAALQSYFVTRIEKYIDAHGRKLIGWDEILEGGLAPRATVMSWQGVKGGIDAARLDHDVVMAPSPTMYMDHVQSTLHDEPPGRPDVVSLADVYRYDPLPVELDAMHAKHILGAQANLWTEYMDTSARVEQAAFPRAAALAEALWSPAQSKRLDGFVARLPDQFRRYRMLDIAYADSVFAPEFAIDSNGPNVAVRVTTQIDAKDIRYSVDGTPPGSSSTRYDGVIETRTNAQLNVSVFEHDRLVAQRRVALDDAALLRKSSDELQSCHPGAGLPLRLPGPAADGGEGVYRVDIFDPCWIYPKVDLDVVHRVRIQAAERPYNFQLWKDEKKVVTRKPGVIGGELEIHLDSCSGSALATLPLAQYLDARGLATLRATLQGARDVHDLCLVFTRATANPLWMIDTVQLEH